MKRLMLGNEAVARGLYEAGCRFVSSYPGTPSTEITEFASTYDSFYSEWAPNEKVAMEAAIGASFAGGRSFTAMKHVGLNVAADPLFTVSYTGVNGGMVIAVADDPGMHSSQNEQDSRHYALAAKLPMLEPADSAECLAYTKAAYELSEEYDTPVILRLSTRVSHSQSIVETAERQEFPLKAEEKNPGKYVMMPSNAIGRHVVVEERQQKLRELAEDCPFNTVEINSTEIGIITAGIAYQYAKEAFGESASYLKLGLIQPLPEKLIKEFAAKVKKVYVLEELDPYIESHCRALGIELIGKEELTLLGEYSQTMLREKLMGIPAEYKEFGATVPGRPPVMCAGCPHRGLFYVLKKLGLKVSGDIGCYTLGSMAPLNSMDATICMGASIGMAHGMEKALGREQAKRTVAVLGDSTFCHSGMTGLLNMMYNRSLGTLIIADNSITGMTGHQNNPANGFDIHGNPAP
ncbi:MAG: indolepyruvate ferredoxin oxidoreductase subunit alpha, partial [Oscillospiraceae bacterium]|nr:indolepyruvate ferredoxin oxidoreductase subunit alpha [Oscillospiraceae bacterium]